MVAKVYLVSADFDLQPLPRQDGRMEVSCPLCETKIVAGTSVGVMKLLLEHLNKLHTRKAGH